MESSSTRRNLKEDPHQDLLASVFEAAIDGIILIDDRGVITDVNQSSLNYFGYDRAELIGKNVSILMGSPDRENHQGYLSNYLKTGQANIISVGREVEGVKKDGTTFPFRLAVSEFSYLDKRYFTGIIHDLSKEKHAEAQMHKYAQNLEKEVLERTKDLKESNRLLEQEIVEKRIADAALKESQKLYRIIAQNFPNGTINVFDEKLNYIFVEGKGLQDLGIHTEDLIGSNFLERIDPNLRETIQSELSQVFEGIPRTFELNANNNVYLLRAEPLRNFNGVVSQILMVETNITQRKRAEEDMAKALAKEIELNELKSRFVSMASHEFRTPLSAILSSAILLAKYDRADQQFNRIKHVGRIKSNVNNLNNILEDFLSLEKLSEGKVGYSPVEIAIESYTAECIEEMEGILKAGQVVELQFEPCGTVMLFDKFIYKNILTNLLSNASKYSGEGDKIEVKLSVDASFIHLSLKDYGIGIPDDDQFDLFTRFFRASNAGNINGTGLGLHIVKSYVDLVGGSIRCESTLGKGTKMILKFPIAE